ncbi:hypothetical protein BZG36_00007 [Bifiguratus adelaidae]|uniref:Golgi apparatus membrane protein TVP23 n=1 Tax=Bifiguratus adelaidae TaxID=1938954 RepID=A0A261Y8X9_9FUNG|nr:hypothetical protein BZG36_00007 [Bifiguratus adelaidae]
MSRQNLLSPTSTPLPPDTDLESGMQGSMAPQQGSGFVKTYIEGSSHPVAVMFFLVFRLGALLTYLLGSFFTDNFTLIFVLCILFLAFDFWTVKNVSGRLLVGLRWWNEVREDGNNVWVFESADPSRKTNPSDSRIFWTTLYLTPALWLLFAFTCLITGKFGWLLIVVVAILLNGANVIGYTSCDKDARKRWAAGATAGVMGNMGFGAGSFMKAMVGNSVTGLFGGRS